MPHCSRENGLGRARRHTSRRPMVDGKLSRPEWTPSPGDTASAKPLDQPAHSTLALVRPKQAPTVRQVNKRPSHDRQARGDGWPGHHRAVPPRQGSRTFRAQDHCTWASQGWGTPGKREQPGLGLCPCHPCTWLLVTRARCTWWQYGGPQNGVSGTR